MKRSEFLISANVSPEQADLLARELESANGVKWDPEEVELPKKLRVYPPMAWNPRLMPDDGPWKDAKQQLAAYAAAADAYNRLQCGEPVPRSCDALDAVRERDELRAEFRRHIAAHARALRVLRVGSALS